MRLFFFLHFLEKLGSLDITRKPSLKVAKNISLSERRKKFENIDERSEFNLNLTQEESHGRVIFRNKSPVFRRRSVNVKETIKSYEFERSPNDKPEVRRFSDLPPCADELTMEDNPLYDNTIGAGHLNQDDAREVCNIFLNGKTNENVLLLPSSLFSFSFNFIPLG